MEACLDCCAACGELINRLEPLLFSRPPCRLLAQLRDMEMAFDEFFEKHHLKLQQYLQLLRYEQNFREVRFAWTKECELCDR